MSIATEISRIQTDRNTIRDKLVELGLASDTDNLTALASAIAEIVNNGAVNTTVTENGTYTIPVGFHNGNGSVTVDVPDREIVLQNKTVTENGIYTADSGYDGLGNVTVDVASSGGGGGNVSCSFVSVG